MHLGDVLSHHGHTHRQRDGEKQAGDSPHPGPECGGQQQRHRRQACVGSVQPRLEDRVAEQVQRCKETQDEQRTGPVVEDCEGKDEGHCGRGEAAHIGNEPQHQGQHAPQRGVGDAYQPQPEADPCAGPGVDQQLHQQIAADPASCIVQRLGGQVEIARSQ